MTVQSTMQTGALTLTMLLRHGAKVHSRSKVITFDGEGYAEQTFAETAVRAERLATGLAHLGVRRDDVVGTFLWNNAAHLEAYLAVPCMGAVLHTLNLRLFPEQLVHVVNESGDKVIIANTTVLGLLAPLADQLSSVEHYILVDDGAPVSDEVRAALGSVIDYEQLLAESDPGYEWPDLEESSAAGICYTSGTTGNPKGVVYSHRSTWLHAFAYNNITTMTLSEADRGLLIVPMFHVNAWGWPYVSWMTGATMVMPSRFLQGPPLVKMIEEQEVTVSAGVPTIWNEVLRELKAHPERDISSLRGLISGGAALPRSILDGFDAHKVRVLQGWGMTETSPLCAVSEPPGFADPFDPDWRMKTGRLAAGVELRIVTAEGTEAPWDGKTTGEIQVRGPWITGTYLGEDSPPEDKFADGWLRTGDIGSMDDLGFLQISDRLKDVIKSGGEWISSVELENEIMGHPAVQEAAVVAMPDDKWSERPLAVVVRSEGAEVTAEQLRDYLNGRVARYWIPENWAFIDQVPKTSVGKFDKKTIRAQREAGELELIATAPPAKG